ncbi:MAG: hypothetical protein QOH88_1592 [Verrucomicrobiota bacterium]
MALLKGIDNEPPKISLKDLVAASCVFLNQVFFELDGEIFA